MSSLLVDKRGGMHYRQRRFDVLAALLGPGFRFTAAQTEPVSVLQAIGLNMNIMDD